MSNPNSISVIIATYNAEKFLKRALDSVYNQSFKNIECIVVDGGSTDKTLDILNEYTEYGIKYISEKDKGIFDALNKGIKLAKNTWIYVLGADDELLPNGFSHFFSIDNYENYDIIYGNTIDRYEDGHLREPQSKDYKLVRYQMFCCHQGMLMKKEMIDNLGGFDLSFPLEADYDLTLRAYLNNYKFKQIKSPIAYFSLQGATGKRTDFIDKEHYQILKKNRSTKFPRVIVTYWAIKKTIKKFILNF